MDADVAEIAPDIFRISIYPTGSPVSYGCFLIRDDEPTMIETGLRGMYDLVHDAVRSLVDPATLRYLVIPHFEMDECGSLNRFLAIAPHAEPVASPLGAVDTLACHHGAVLTGDPRRYYRALRENVVGDVIDAPFYDPRSMNGGAA